MSDGGPAVDDLTLVLASASPRRRILLEGLALDFEVRTADLDESPRPDETAAALAVRLAGEKAAAVVGPGEVAIAADTVVAIDGVLLGKPSDPDDARRMLGMLSDRTHQVTTGVAVHLHPSGRDGAGGTRRDRAQTGTRAVVTDVRFVALSTDDIDWYVGTGEPLDKAGAYGLQGVGGHLIRSVQGSPTNVIGLPLAETIELAGSIGVDLRRFRRSSARAPDRAGGTRR
jgi:septum formation protein